MRAQSEQEKKETGRAVEALFASGDFKVVEGVFVPSTKPSILGSCLIGAACFIVGYALMLGIKYLQH